MKKTVFPALVAGAVIATAAATVGFFAAKEMDNKHSKNHDLDESLINAKIACDIKKDNLQEAIDELNGKIDTVIVDKSFGTQAENMENSNLEDIITDKITKNFDEQAFLIDEDVEEIIMSNDYMSQSEELDKELKSLDLEQLCASLVDKIAI